MAHIVRLQGPGGVDRFAHVEEAIAPPGPGELRIRHGAIGLNFIDVYQRTGLYPLPYPAVLGLEGSAIVEAVGSGVSNVRVGDRIAYAGEVGAYASERILPATRAIVLPDSIDDPTGAVLLARGITAHMLMNEVFVVEAETTALILSAAGGLGGLLVRTAKARGATVIATVSSDAKAQIARAHGADHVIVGRDADYAAAVADITGGRKVDVAYDGVGGSTLTRTFDCVRAFGTVASIGQAGGPIPPIAVEEIGPRRSLVFARPSVMHYMRDPKRYRAAAEAVIASAVRPDVGRSYRLSEIARAHDDLERGDTNGCSYLVP